MNTEIRLLQTTDVRTIKEMSKLFWDGSDYLGRVAKSWIQDGGFFGLFEGSELIGCAKLTKLPDKVIWLEGLRIHPEFQKKGLGQDLSSTVMNLALGMLSEGDADYIEFSTYYLNVESIHIAQKAGFKLVDELYVLNHKPVKSTAPDHYSRIREDVMDYFPDFIPYGWKFLHPTRQSINWLNKKLQLTRAGGGYFYVGGDQPTVILLTPAGEWVTDALPVMQHLLGKKVPIEIMLHSSRKDEIPILQTLDFHWWEDNNEDKVLIYRYFPQ